MAPWASGPRFEQTSALIMLPDDCTVGFIVEKRLGISMVHSNMFHSHLENLLLLAASEIPKQVTLSYGWFENKMNSVELRGVFTKDEDPSRFRTVHCLLYPTTNWCPVALKSALAWNQKVLPWCSGLNGLQSVMFVKIFLFSWKVKPNDNVCLPRFCTFSKISSTHFRSWADLCEFLKTSAFEDTWLQSKADSQVHMHRLNIPEVYTSLR